MLGQLNELLERNFFTANLLIKTQHIECGFYNFSWPVVLEEFHQLFTTLRKAALDDTLIRATLGRRQQ